MVTRKTTILLVGCGSIGQRHARLLGERRDVELWLCDINEAHLEATVAVVPEARVFGELDAGLSEGPDAVFVCTPEGLHRPMSVAALEAGCDVFCEKPLAETLVNAEAILAAAEASSQMLQVGYVLRCHPAIRRINEMVTAGELGNLIGGRAMVGSYYTLMCAKTPHLLEDENALILGYTHQLDYLSLFLGKAVRVSAEVATLGDLEMLPQPNVFSAVLKYESEAIAQVHLDFVQLPERHALELFGDRKTVVYDANMMELRSFERDYDGHRTQLIPIPRDDMYRTQIDEFLKSVRGDRIPIVSAADGVAAVKTAEAAVLSAREHRAVEI